MIPVFEGFCHESCKSYLFQEIHQMKNYNHYRQSQSPFMYAIYVVVLFTTVKHPQNRSVGKVRCDKYIQEELSLVKI